jgi:carbonic anhydrase/acetyltransferase-like protein (isoleucine patch superfamily)
MDRTQRRRRGYRPASEIMEARTVLSGGLVAPPVSFIHLGLYGALGAQLARPNTPVAPYGATSTASFVDPSVTIKNGNHIVVGTKDYIAPWATLDGRQGIIQVGNSTTIQDNATLVANTVPGGPHTSGIILGDNVYIGPGATILGPAVIGAARGGANTSIGPNAVVDQAIIMPGAQVGALAFVGPGITIPAGFAVKPGVSVTTEEQATDPALGFVTKITGTNTILANALADSASLAAQSTGNSTTPLVGYTWLYQGQSATGSSALSSSSSVFNGNLAVVSGVSPSPGFNFTTTTTTNVTNAAGAVIGSFSTTSTTTIASATPKFTNPANGNVTGLTTPFYPGREIGSVTFQAGPLVIKKVLGFHNSIRFDSDQAGTIGAPARLGRFVTIHPIRGGKVTIGSGLTTGDHVVLTADANGNLTLGTNVTIGSNSVINGSNLGNDVQVGPGSYIVDSTVPAGTALPAGTILIKNVLS